MLLCLSTAEFKNQLATKYQESELFQKVLEELNHVNQSTDEGVKGRDEAANYVTSFLYQVRQIRNILKYCCIKNIVK